MKVANEICVTRVKKYVPLTDKNIGDILYYVIRGLYEVCLATK